MNEKTITTQLDGVITKLTEEETALLFDYRIVSKEQQNEIFALIETLSK